MSIFAHSLGSVMCFDLMHETCRVKGLLKDHMQDLNVEREGGAFKKMDVESTQDDRDMTGYISFDNYIFVNKGYIVYI